VSRGAEAQISEHAREISDPFYEVGTHYMVVLVLVLVLLLLLLTCVYVILQRKKIHMCIFTCKIIFFFSENVTRADLTAFFVFPNINTHTHTEPIFFFFKRGPLDQWKPTQYSLYTHIITFFL